MTTKIDNLLNALNAGQELTNAQIQTRFGFENESSVASAIRTLRNEGFSIYKNSYRNGVKKFRLGTPRRSVVAAGIRSLGTSVLA